MIQQMKSLQKILHPILNYGTIYADKGKSNLELYKV
jgi:hypothetical protein